MPTYDYQCRSCGTVTEVIHAMTADGPTVCERCGGELRRVLYPAGIIFKGSGFYRTDSRAGSSTETSSSTKPATGTSTGTTGSGGGTSTSSGASAGGSVSPDSGSGSASSGGESAA